MSLMITFTSMYGYVETAIDTAVSSFGSGLVSFVAAPLGVAATIYFLLLGFAVLRGAIQAPLRELVFQAGKVGFALAAASAVGYSAFVVNVATNLPTEIIAAGSGTAVTNPGTTFDTYVSDTNKIAQIISDENDKVQSQTVGLTDIDLAAEKLFANFVAFLAIIVLYIFAALSAAVGFCIVIFAKLAVAICVALAPRASLIKNRDFLLSAGTVIPCTLQTAINSTQAGFVSCVINHDVYSEDGRVVLLDKGTKVLGQYSGGITQGQARMFVLWTRALTPRGVAIDLGSPAADALGRSGMSGGVDTQFWARFGAALMMSVLEDASNIAGRAVANEGTYTTQVPSEMGNTILQDSKNIKPILKKNQGDTAAIFVAKDFDFSPVYDLKLRR